MEDWKGGCRSAHLPSFHPSTRAGFLLSCKVSTHFFRNLKHASNSVPKFFCILNSFLSVPTIPLHEIIYEFVVTTSVVYDAQEATQVATTNTGRNSVERYILIDKTGIIRYHDVGYCAGGEKDREWRIREFLQ